MIGIFCQDSESFLPNGKMGNFQWRLDIPVNKVVPYLPYDMNNHKSAADMEVCQMSLMKNPVPNLMEKER